MGTDRIGFLVPEVRALFFESCKTELSCTSWNAFYLFLRIRKTLCERYRSGELLVPEKLFIALLNTLPASQQSFFLTNSFSKPVGWGRSLGGHKTSSLYPQIIASARLRAKEQIVNRPSNNFDLNQPITKELCEFVGAFIGDGHTNKYGRHFIIGFAGHANLDYEYYEKTIIPIAKKLFSFKTCSVW